MNLAQLLAHPPTPLSMWRDIDPAKDFLIEKNCMKDKLCKECGKEYPLADFAPMKRKGRRSPVCVHCESQQSMADKEALTLAAISAQLTDRPQTIAHIALHSRTTTYRVRMRIAKFARCIEGTKPSRWVKL